jgi:hypothetical protein
LSLGRNYIKIQLRASLVDFSFSPLIKHQPVPAPSINPSVKGKRKSEDVSLVVPSLYRSWITFVLFLEYMEELGG